MQYAPARRALAGSVLVLGSVGTVSAVHLDAAQVAQTPDGRSAAAVAPPAPPGPRTAAPEMDTSTLDAPAVSSPSPSHRSTTRRSSNTPDRPVTSRDLIDMAHRPRGTGSVVVPVHDLGRTLPQRATSRIGRHDVLGAGLRSLDDILEIDRVRTSGYGRHSIADRTSYPRGGDSYGGHSYGGHSYGGHSYGGDSYGSDFDRVDRYQRADRPSAGYRQADLSWDFDDVSYSRPRCGRHRA